MKLLRNYIIPGIATLCLHGLLLYVATHVWDEPGEIRKITKQLPTVKATLVMLEKPKPKPQPKAKPKPKTTPKAAPKPKPKPKLKPKPKPKPVPKVDPKAKEKALAEEKRRQEEQRRQEKKRAEQQLAEAMAEEEEFWQAQSDEELASSYIGVIQEAVQYHWTRPPSARNNMEATLLIQLIPTGEVVNVSVSKSSGNEAFDRAAVNAVKQAERFPELKDLPPRVFDTHFRRLRLIFRPEDLRL